MVRFQMNHNRFRRESKTNRTVILQWWNFEKPFFEKMPTQCGGCWTSNDRKRLYNMIEFFIINMIILVRFIVGFAYFGISETENRTK